MTPDHRYKMQHLGDTVVDALSCVANSARRRARRVVLTYDIRALEKKRRQCLGLIGNRIVQVRRAGVADVTRDDNLVEMIADIGQIDRVIATFDQKRVMTTNLCGGENACHHANACRLRVNGPPTAQGDPT